MATNLVLGTGSSEAGPAYSPPTASIKELTCPNWMWNQINNVVSNLHDNKDEWFKTIKESMNTTGNEKLLGHVDDLEVFIDHVVELSITLWNTATGDGPHRLQFALEQKLVGQLAKIPPSSHSWLRYISKTLRPLVHSDVLASVFSAVNTFTEFVVEMNVTLARIYPQ